MEIFDGILDSRVDQDEEDGDEEVFFTTLWSPVPPEHIADVQYGMNDTRYICYRGRDPQQCP